MEPAILPGDIIMVSKMSYGARVLKPMKFLKHKKIEYVRTKGWNSIKKGDTFVFNYPVYDSYSGSSPNIYGHCLVKRCYALPGDSVIINNEGINNEGIWNERTKNDGMPEIQNRGNAFPYDTILDWSVGNYGPLYVPAKGQSMELTKRNVCWYKDILRYENPYNHIKDSLLTIDGKTVLRYTFQHNYYFMLGDNFYNSNDSRYWGFVPDGNVIGKVVVVLFSIDPDEFGLKKIRWSRLLKII